MAQYVTRIETPLLPAEAFTYMADLRNFAAWDPGVEAATQVEGRGPGPDAAYDVIVDAPGKGLTLRYRTVEYDEPRSVVVRATSRTFTSEDTVTVEPAGAGSLVTYRAELDLNGALRVFDVVLRPIFGRIAGRANEGLLQALDGIQR
jgi:carbon monoxide dehydrogenase subunit G